MKQPDLLLVASAAVYLVAGIALLFAPAELLAAAGEPASILPVAVLQVLGSALFGFAMLNWMHRHSTVGGIFGRPLVMANLAHAGSAALLLARPPVERDPAVVLLVALGIYAVFAIGFGSRLFVTPRAARKA